MPIRVSHRCLPLIVGGLSLLALAACGRRGAPEPPPLDPAAPPSQVETPALSPPGALRKSRAAREGYVVPDKPFILDPLL